MGVYYLIMIALIVAGVIVLIVLSSPVRKLKKELTAEVERIGMSEFIKYIIGPGSYMWEGYTHPVSSSIHLVTDSPMKFVNDFMRSVGRAPMGSDKEHYWIRTRLGKPREQDLMSLIAKIKEKPDVSQRPAHY